MRISPEPLSPLRSWRELWQPESTDYGPTDSARRASDTSFWKQQKSSSFHWFNYLFNRKQDK